MVFKRPLTIRQVLAETSLMPTTAAAKDAIHDRDESKQALPDGEQP